MRLLHHRESQLGKGYVQELRAAHRLESEGYFVVRSYRSSGPVDLVGIPLEPPDTTAPRPVRLIQVKAGTSLTAAQRRELVHLADSLPPTVRVEVWSYRGGALMPEVEVIEVE